ncbi:MAG: L,D-transpeptidase, partial [Ktedonobacterales bacterium]
IIDDARALNPLTAYEYADGSEGIGDVQQKFDAAAASNDYQMYQTADDAAQIMIANLRALLDNLHDATPASQPHQTDLQLMQHYGIMSGKNIVVSLREQVARFYDNGKLVYWSYVTTGRPEAVSPPGLHYAMEKDYHIEFKSSAPPGSPLWYGPTKINYAVLYADYGYFLHDAWWRLKFGPGSNLPHADGLAFNGGSHGCVNFPEDNMAYVYEWTDVGDPIILY